MPSDGFGPLLVNHPKSSVILQSLKGDGKKIGKNVYNLMCGIHVVKSILLNRLN
jgi:hypothetical protein